MGEGFCFPGFCRWLFLDCQKRKRIDMCDFKVELWFHFRNIVNHFQTRLKQACDGFCCTRDYGANGRHVLHLLVPLSSDALILLFRDERVNEGECFSALCFSDKVLRAPQQRRLTTL